MNSKITYEDKCRVEAEAAMVHQNATIRRQFWQTCLNCEHWINNPQKNQVGCIIARALPPPDVIVVGCPQYVPDIPF